VGAVDEKVYPVRRKNLSGEPETNSDKFRRRAG